MYSEAEEIMQVKLTELINNLNSEAPSDKHKQLIKKMLRLTNGTNGLKSNIDVYIYTAVNEDGKALFISKRNNYFLTSDIDELYVHNAKSIVNMKYELPRIISEEFKVAKHRFTFENEWYKQLTSDIEKESKLIQELANGKFDNLLDRYPEKSIQKVYRLLDDYRYYNTDEVYCILMKCKKGTYFYSNVTKSHITRALKDIHFFNDLTEANKEFKRVSEYNEIYALNLVKIRLKGDEDT